MKQLAMRWETLYPYCDAVRFDFDSILFNVMIVDAIQWKKYDRFYFFGSDSKS